MRPSIFLFIWTLPAMLYLFGSCGDHPCSRAIPMAEASGSGGDATLSGQVVVQTGVPGKQERSIGCVDMLVIDAHDYSDTLFAATVPTSENRLSISDLAKRTVDVIIDRDRFYPVKIPGIELNAGENHLGAKVLMYERGTVIAIPGALGLTLKEGATLDQVASIYKVYDGIRVMPVPEGYEFELPFRGRRLTRQNVESLCRALLASPYVASARPLVNMTTVVPAL